MNAPDSHGPHRLVRCGSFCQLFQVSLSSLPWTSTSFDNSPKQRSEGCRRPRVTGALRTTRNLQGNAAIDGRGRPSYVLGPDITLHFHSARRLRRRRWGGGERGGTSSRASLPNLGSCQTSWQGANAKSNSRTSALSELSFRVAGLARVQAKWLIARSLATPATTTTPILSVDRALARISHEGRTEVAESPAGTAQLDK